MDIFQYISAHKYNKHSGINEGNLRNNSIDEGGRDKEDGYGYGFLNLCHLLLQQITWPHRTCFFVNTLNWG